MWTLKNRPINMGGEERGGLQTMLPYSGPSTQLLLNMILSVKQRQHLGSHKTTSCLGIFASDNRCSTRGRRGGSGQPKAQTEHTQL